MLEARTSPAPVPRPANPAAVARLLAGMAREQARCGRRGRPFVTLSWAQSLDGCIAREPGQRTVISGDETMALAHALRAAHDGILIGVGTLVADDPALTVRFWTGESPTPVVLDTRLRTPLTSRLVLAGQQRPVFFACTDAGEEDKRQRLEMLGARVLRLPACESGWVDLPALLRALDGAGVRRLMVEGGAKVLTSFLRAGLGDYAIVTIAPRILGGLPAVSRLLPEDLQQLGTPVYEQLGQDIVMAGPLAGAR